MAVEGVAGLKLIADEATFLSIMTDLKGQIDQLGEKKNQYQALKNRIDDVWSTSDGESEEYKKAIDNQIHNIDLALQSVVSAFETFGKLDEHLQKALGSAKALAETVADEAKELFV